MSQHDSLEELKEYTSRIVEMAMKGGAATAVASMSRKSNSEIEVRHGEVENLSQAESHALALGISKDGRRATATTCDISKDGMEALVAQALALSNYTDKDKYYSLPDKDLLATETHDYDLFDEKVLSLQVEDKIKAVVRLEEELKAIDPRLKCDGASFTTMAGASALANSLGFCQAESTTIVDMGVSAFAEDLVDENDLNSGRKQTSNWFSRGHHLEDLDTLEVIAQTCANRVLRKLGARKPQTGRFPVYFDPNTARTLWRHLVTAISGSEIYRGESYLVDRLNTSVAASQVEIIEDPTIPRGLSSKSFDDEGVACRKRAIVSEGQLQTYLLNTYAANKLGTKSSGHAGGPANLIITPGEKSEKELLREMGTGVWVTGLLGQGINISTGDYSRGAQGLWIENGEIAYPIMEFTLNSNLNKMFHDIVMIGANLDKRWSIRSPGILVQEMTLSGS